MAYRSLSFGARLAGLLAQVYPQLDIGILVPEVIGAYWPEGRHRRTRPRRLGDTTWSERDAVLISYGDSLIDGTHKPLFLLHDFLLEHMTGVVNRVHILPFFPWSSDDGFAVTDYRAVDDKLGDWSDITRIGQDFQLMSDLVVNHVSSQSAWFDAFLEDRPPFNGYFLTADPGDDLSAVVRPRTSPLLRKVETSRGPRHVWCTFSHDQVDLDFANPEVLIEMLRVVRLHIDKGVRIIRLDAVAFLWKQIGTPCIHLPETHAVVKLLRLLADFSTESVVILTETNVPTAENLSYFGTRDEAHMVYNFPLPPLVLHAVLSGSADYLSKWQRGMPPAPNGCTYLNFTASHDGIGMRPAEGVLPDAEVERMIETVKAEGGLASMRALPGGGEAVYELNTSFFDAMGRTFKGEDGRKIDRFICSQTIVMSLEGMPAFYIHSMLATPNDLEGVARRGANRAINRHRWDIADLQERLADPDSDQAQVLGRLTDRLKLRARQPAFHPDAAQLTLSLDARVFGVWRQSLDRRQSIFALHNVSDQTVEIPAIQLNLNEGEAWADLISGEPVRPGEGRVALAPYQCRWIANSH